MHSQENFLHPSLLVDCEKYKNQLMAWLESIKNWDNYSDFDKENVIEFFMDSIGFLYLDYFQWHLDEAKSYGQVYEALLKSSFKDVSIFYVIRKEFRLTNQDEWADLWEKACWTKTNIIAFNLMFGELAGNLNDEDVEEYIEARRGSVHADRKVIPKNAPESHWWWFATYS